MAWKPSSSVIDGVASARSAKRARDFRAGAVALHMHDAGCGMRRLAAQRQRAVGVAVERRAEGEQIVDARRALRARPASTISRIAEAGARRRSCRRHGLCQLSPAPIAAAMPPCAQALEPDSAGPRARQHQRGEGRELQRGEQAREARAQNQRALGFDDVVDVAAHAHAAFCTGSFTASMRSTARLRARGDRRDRRSLRCVIVSSAVQDLRQRDALHVRAEIAGPHEFDIGIFDRDIVAHRAFGDHHHARWAGACRHN